MALAVSPKRKKELPTLGCVALSGTSLASVESLSMPLMQEVVLSADIRCADCQKRLADIISRMNETESISVNLSEKKVTLTCRYSPVVKLPRQQVATIHGRPFSKIAIFKRIFNYSSRNFLPAKKSSATHTNFS